MVHQKKKRRQSCQPLLSLTDFLDTCCLSRTIAQISQLVSSYLTLADNFDLIDDRRMQRERSLHTDLVGDLADSKRLSDASAFLGNDHALEYLDTGLIAFLDLYVYADCAS